MKFLFIIFFIIGLISCGIHAPKPPTYYGNPRIPVNQIIPPEVPAPSLHALVTT